MLKSDVMAHFRTNVAVAALLGISDAAVSQWGAVVPLESATALELLTRGRVRVDRTKYPILARAAKTTTKVAVRN